MNLAPINVKIALLASSRRQAPRLAPSARLASTRGRKAKALVLTVKPGNISLIRDNALAQNAQSEKRKGQGVQQLARIVRMEKRFPQR